MTHPPAKDLSWDDGGRDQDYELQEAEELKKLGELIPKLLDATSTQLLEDLGLTFEGTLLDEVATAALERRKWNLISPKKTAEPLTEEERLG